MNKSRPKQLSFRVSEEEYKQLQEKIAKSGKKQQEYILSCVLEKEIVNTDGIREIVPEMKRQGANLNQLVKKLNERGYIDYKKELPTTLGEVRAVWQLLKQYLQGQA
ncbi:MAG: plasmid mobilization protein [Faecalibacterium prausnitzii]